MTTVQELTWVTQLGRSHETPEPAQYIHDRCTQPDSG